MLNGLDLFSGIGGIGLALAPWVRTVAYCERDRYAQAVILSRIASGEIDNAPIWDDVKTLRGGWLPPIDIIFGGFPCQDISAAGKGAGLEGERSGLFFEIMRLVDETRPQFIFLENVAAITVRGLGTVTAEIARRGYDCRWTTLSAAEVGANHKRDRWWLLAYNNRIGGGSKQELSSLKGKTDTHHNGEKESLADASGQRARGLSARSRGEWKGEGDVDGRGETLANTGSAGREEFHSPAQPGLAGFGPGRATSIWSSEWWATEPDVGRVADGVPSRVDRIKCLGNSVVPLCAREAFKELMGL